MSGQQTAGKDGTTRRLMDEIAKLRALVEAIARHQSSFYLHPDLRKELLTALTNEQERK